MKEESRLILAFALSILIIILFSVYQSQKMPKNTISSNPAQTAPGQSPSQTTPAQTETGNKNQCKFSDKEIGFENSLFSSVMDPLGGKIKYFGLKNFTKPGEKLFTFFDSGYTFADFYQPRTEELSYQQEPEKQPDQIILKAVSSSYLIEKSIEYAPNRYTFDFNLNIKNTGNIETKLTGAMLYLGKITTVQAASYSLGKGSFGAGSNETFPEFIVQNDMDNIQKINLQKTTKEETVVNVKSVIVRTRFQLYYFKFQQPVEIFAESGINPADRTSYIDWGINIPETLLKSGDTYQLPITAYIGPSDYLIARNEISEQWVFGTGFFASTGRFISRGLNAIHKIIPNWGWAIIILTIVIKVVFFPLTRNSIKSMKQMQKLRPYLKDIQTKYKDNPQLMQKELMNLYKTYKINPFGGCLPMLIQWPIFVGFFLALRNSISLRGSPFILWIKDLTVPDTLFHISTVPVNILPVIMFITYIFQQKMTPQMDPSQKYMTYIFPFLMLFLFYNFSSGLLLYWVTMSGLGLLEQWYIGKSK